MGSSSEKGSSLRDIPPPPAPTHTHTALDQTGCSGPCSFSPLANNTSSKGSWSPWDFPYSNTWTPSRGPSEQPCQEVCVLYVGSTEVSAPPTHTVFPASHGRYIHSRILSSSYSQPRAQSPGPFFASQPLVGMNEFPLVGFWSILKNSQGCSWLCSSSVPPVVLREVQIVPN